MQHMFNRYVLFNFAGRGSRDQDADPAWAQLFGIPLFVGLFGLYWQFRKDWRMATSFLLLFIIMGYLIAFYQNQQEPQPRERDYFYAGAYFIFAVWIALGMRGLLDLVSGAARAPRQAVSGCAAVLLLAPHSSRENAADELRLARPLQKLAGMGLCVQHAPDMRAGCHPVHQRGQ